MAAPLVVTGAMLMCPFGLSPASLVVIPKGPPVLISNMPAATIMDHVPIANIATFGVCTSPSNPASVAAKAAGSPGAPCVPVTATPWTPGSPQVLIGGVPALNASSTCMCSLAAGGPITITNPGQTTVIG
jgi:hypothetical protein